MYQTANYLSFSVDVKKAMPVKKEKKNLNSLFQIRRIFCTFLTTRMAALSHNKYSILAPVHVDHMMIVQCLNRISGDIVPLAIISTVTNSLNFPMLVYLSCCGVKQ